MAIIQIWQGVVKANDPAQQIMKISYNRLENNNKGKMKRLFSLIIIILVVSLAVKMLPNLKTKFLSKQVTIKTP